MEEIRNIPHPIPRPDRTHTLIPYGPISNPIPISPVLDLIDPDDPVLTSKSLFEKSKFHVLIAYKRVSVIIKASALA